MTVFQAFSQFERDLIVERTKEGLKSARARGKMVEDHELIDEILKEQ